MKYSSFIGKHHIFGKLSRCDYLFVLVIIVQLFFTNLWAWREIDRTQGGDEIDYDYSCTDFSDHIFWLVTGFAWALISEAVSRIFIAGINKTQCQMEWFCWTATMITCSILFLLAFSIMPGNPLDDADVLCEDVRFFVVPWVGLIGWYLVQFILLTIFYHICQCGKKTEEPDYNEMMDKRCCQCCFKSKRRQASSIKDVNELNRNIQLEITQPSSVSNDDAPDASVQQVHENKSVTTSAAKGAIKGAAKAAITGNDPLLGLVAGATKGAVGTHVANKTQNQAAGTIAGSMAKAAVNVAAADA